MVLKRNIKVGKYEREKNELSQQIFIQEELIVKSEKRIDGIRKMREKIKNEKLDNIDDVSRMLSNI